MVWPLFLLIRCSHDYFHQMPQMLVHPKRCVFVVNFDAITHICVVQRQCFLSFDAFAKLMSAVLLKFV